MMGVFVKVSYTGILFKMKNAEETMQKDLTKARLLAIINPLAIPQLNHLEEHHRIWEDMMKVVEDIVNLDWTQDESAESKYRSLSAHWDDLMKERDKTEKEFESLH